jgi:hypothetical protein
MAVVRPALAWCRLAGKYPIVLDETRASVATQPIARPVQVHEGPLQHPTLRFRRVVVFTAPCTTRRQYINIYLYIEKSSYFIGLQGREGTDRRDPR